MPRTQIRRIKRGSLCCADAIVPLVHMPPLDPPHVATEVEDAAGGAGRRRQRRPAVDRLREGTTSSPPMEVLAGIRGYWSALLGDGRVLLVLNLKELL